MTRFKNIAVVTLVSMLIWLWAEVSVFNDRRSGGSEELELTSVPVLVAGESSVLSRYSITPDLPRIAALRVRGPRDVMDDIRAGKIKPAVYVTITDDDAAVERLRLPADIGPAHLGLTIEGDLPMVTLRISRR